MSLLEVIRYIPSKNSDWLVYRYAGSAFRNGSKLIIEPGQRAICVNGGKVCGEFKNGTTELTTADYPFLDKMINAVHGGDNPMPFEIYFFNSAVRLKNPWGTKTPAMLKDPSSNLPVHVRAYGSYNFRLGDFQFFLTEWAGALADQGMITYDEVTQRLDGIIQQTIQKALGDAMSKRKVPVLELPSETLTFSQSLQEAANPYFAKYGFEITDITTESINFPDSDIAALKKRAEFDVLGTSYERNRTLDIQEKWAQNEGSAGGLAMAGVGAAIGLNALGQAAKGNVAPAILPENITPSTPTPAAPETKAEPTVTPPAPQEAPAAKAKEEKPLAPGNKHCCSCGEEIPARSKFCPYCGAKQSLHCPKCGAELPEGAHFCLECGEKIG
jgi:membrane protease subunit (stomatin/prohibitin family)